VGSLNKFPPKWTESHFVRKASRVAEPLVSNKTRWVSPSLKKPPPIVERMSIYPPTGTLEIKDATLKIPVIDLQYTSNTAKIEANSNVVTEFQRSKKLIKYPRVALTQNDESGTSGYVASASTSVSTRGPYQAFDNVLYSSWHEPVYQSSPYPNTDGAYTGGSGTVYDTNGYQGEYLQIQLPGKIKLYNYSISNRPAAGIEGRQPKDAKIFASNDGNTWIDIHTHGDGGGTYDIAGETRSFQLDNITETHYKYYRLVINSIIQGGTSDTANISQWQLYGIPEYDPDADGVNVVVKSVPNVPNTDWLEVYYDAKDLADGVVTSVSDLKPSSLGSAINSTSVTDVSVSDGAFVFNGTTSGIDATLSNPQGPWIHSVSVWIKLSRDHSEYNDDNVFCIGSAAVSAQLESLRINSNDVRFVTFQGGADEIFPLPMDRNRWYHFTLTYDGGASKQSFRLFRNGIESIGTTTATPVALNVAANSLLSVGYERVRNRSHFPGSITKFRIFNRALTPDEVWQLYAYQKEYFGHGDLSMTLKAGRLGIGTSEPRAALDVRGGVNFHSLLASASGGAESQITDQGIAYKVHSFTSTGTSQITVDKAGFFECLVTAGGGAGGRSNGAGGGGGGVVIQKVFVHTGTYDVVVGAGNTNGVREPFGGSNRTYIEYPSGNRGGNSSVFGLLAIGGGNGGGDDHCGVDGGSGGGCADDPHVIPGRSVQNQEGSNGYGNRGGYTRFNASAGSGGGGAGEPGYDCDPDRFLADANNSWTALGRDGGNGVGSTIRTGSIQYYGGGGGGAQRTTAPTDQPGPGVGGKGGGANGASANGTGSTGSDNTGGGGGGTSHNNSNGGNGGSGIVVVRYKI